MPMRLIAFLTMPILLLTGCNSEPTPMVPDAAPAVSAANEPTAQPAPAGESQDAAGKLQDAWNQIRKKGGTAVDSAGDLLGQLKESGGKAGTNAMEWAQKQFEEAKAAGETQANNATEWIQEDLKQAGTWQYKVVVTQNTDPEAVQKQLNQLGAERWDCYSSESYGQGLMLQLKRPNKSVIRSLPARDVLRLLPLLGMGGGE